MNLNEFKRRRQQLMNMVEEDSILILPSAPIAVRNRDVHFPYRQDSDFFYLTGFPEPDALAVLIPGRADGEYVLFCRERDPKREIWEGPIAGQEGAVELYGADDSFPIDDLEDILPGMLEKCRRVVYSVGSFPDLDRSIGEWVNKIRTHARNGISGPTEFVSLDHFLHDLRLYKSTAEIDKMRQAARISAAAHRALMQTCRPGLSEYQLEATFVHRCMAQDARHQAYPAIVGGGNNACVLHYVSNDAELEDGDLVLIDAGCEFDYYASDITRTFPVNGKFSKPQRQLYELVLAAQLAAIEQVKPGNHWNDPHEAAVRVLTEGMAELKILKGDPDKLIEDEDYKRFFMHRTGHWLGMDVHDVGDYKVDEEWRVFEPGMVLTVEPGLYIPRGSKKVAKRWQGIGIRIEDDVLVTKTGHEILSQDVPKTADEIETLMATT